jgi:hypothetical protein
MKKITKLLPIAISGIALYCAFFETPKDIERPRARITFVVKDDFGKPVANAPVEAWTFHHWVPSSGFGKDIESRYTKQTDSNGIAEIEGVSANGDFKYQIHGQGRYYNATYHGAGHRFAEKKNGRWEPWNPTIEIIYKPILNPIAYIGGGGRIVLPQRAAPMGFDLFVNDWVAPNGKGVQTDIIFTLEEKIPYESHSKPYDSRLTVSFPNKGDGIQSCFAPRNDWGLPMPRYAPKDGYESKEELKFGRDKNLYFSYSRREDQNYFFRIRTVLDEKGKVKSAIYGKIPGDINCDVVSSKTGLLLFHYELNPTPLDVNMEFDREKNLLSKKRR